MTLLLSDRHEYFPTRVVLRRTRRSEPGWFFLVVALFFFSALSCSGAQFLCLVNQVDLLDEYLIAMEKYTVETWSVKHLDEMR